MVWIFSLLEKTPKFIHPSYSPLRHFEDFEEVDLHSCKNSFDQ
jgi:hypothetical protein